VSLRVDDLAGPRVKREASAEAIRDLTWLGLDWDDGPHFQSSDLTPYRGAMEDLAARGHVYPSAMTRKEVEEALAAPHGAPERSGESRFPAELRPEERPRSFASQQGVGWRFATPKVEVAFDDEFAGLQRQRPFESVGDFVVWTKEGEPAYQLATVVDDHRFGITHIVRGDDLLNSAARQLLLFRALGYEPEPGFIHLPLVVGPDGRRLAKRHGDTRLSHYREAGAAPERIVGLLAWWSGASGSRAPMTAATFVERFSLDTMPRDETVFTAEDDAWLLGE